MAKNKKKGFTLIELLAVIVIVGVIGSATVNIFLSAINNSKRNASVIAMNNLKEAAILYGREKTSSIPWNTYKDSSKEYKYVCMSVLDLINHGYFNKDFYKKEIYQNKINANTYIQMSQSSNNSELDVKIVEEKDKEICENNFAEETFDEEIFNIITDFKIDTTETFSDRFFTNVSMTTNELKNKVDFKGKIYNKSYECKNNKCSFTSLKSNTNYEYNLCIYPKYGSGLNFEELCKSFSNKTSKILEPLIQTSLDDKNNLIYKAKITYEDTNIYNNMGYHYFMSETAGTTDTNVFLCKKTQNKGSSCEKEATNSVKAGNWYRTLNNNVTITTMSLRSFVGKKLNINAKTLDESDNEASATKTIEPKYDSCNISYQLDGGKNNTSNPNIYNVNNSTITLKNPTKIGYTFTGWTGSNGTTPTKNLKINLNSCNLSYKANWTRSFTCGKTGSNTTYMGKSWYTNSNDGTYCDLSLNATVGSSSGNKYNDASGTSSNSVYNYIKDYSNSTDKLSDEYNASLINSIDTNSGTGNASNISGYWWHESNKVYYGNVINTYESSECHYYFYGGFKVDSKDDGKNGKEDVTKAKYCTSNSKTSYSGSLSATNSDASKIYSNTTLNTKNTIRKVSRYVNTFTYKSSDSNSVTFKRDVYYLTDDGEWKSISKSGSLISDGTPRKGKDNKSGCPHKKSSEGYDDTNCPEVNHTTKAKSYSIKACGQEISDGAIAKDSNGNPKELFYKTGIKSGTYIFAGGYNYIYGKNTANRYLTAYDGGTTGNCGNCYNAPGSDCELYSYYEVGGSTTVKYMYRPHIRVKIK